MNLLLLFSVLGLATGSFSAQFALAEEAEAAGSVEASDEPEKAIGFGASYKFEVNRGLKGAPNPTTALLGSLNLQAEFSGSKLLHVPGLKAYLDVLINHGGMPSSFNGDASYSSNIETNLSGRTHEAGLYEAWIEKTLGDRFSVLAGVRDINADFYSTEPALGFLNSTFGLGAELSNTGESGPSYWPKPTLGVRVKADLGYSIYAQIAAFQASGGLGIVEAGWTTRTPSGGQSKIAVGAWTYFKMADSLVQPAAPSVPSDTPTVLSIEAAEAPAAMDSEPTHQATAFGAYVLSDYGVSRNVSVFARVGTAQGGVSRFGWSGTAGIWANSVFYKGGSVGLGYFHLEHSQDYRQAQAEAGTPVLSGERGFELSYKVTLWEGATIQPDLQYILTPSGTEGAPDVIVGAVRFAMAL